MSIENSELICAEDVECLPVEWVWANRIPLGTVTTIAGMPGLGKSTLMSEVAAAVTTGRLLPGDEDEFDGPKTPGVVVWMTTEESNDQAVIPRLKAVGADGRRVWVINQSKDKRSWSYSLDTPTARGQFETELANLRVHLQMAESEPMLVIMDAIKGFKPTKDESANVRSFIQDLSAIAQRQRAAIVGIMHFNKSDDQQRDAMNRFSGLLEWVSVPRTAIGMVEHDTGTMKIRIVDMVKNNLSPMPTPQAFQVDTFEMEEKGQKKPIKVGRIKWMGVSPVNLRDAMIPVERQTQLDPNKRLRAIKGIVARLLEGPQNSALLRQELALELKIHEDTLGDAMRSLGIVRKSPYMWLEKPGNSSSGFYMVKLPPLGSFTPDVEAVVQGVYEDLGYPIISDSADQGAKE